MLSKYRYQEPFYTDESKSDFTTERVVYSDSSEFQTCTSPYLKPEFSITSAKLFEIKLCLKSTPKPKKY